MSGNKKESMPILVKAGDERVLLNGVAPKVDVRVVAEELYQRMYKTYISTPKILSALKDAIEAHEIHLK